MRHRLWIGPLLVLALATQGLAWSQEKKEPEATPSKKTPPPSPLKRFDGCTVVFVINGVGGSTLVSDNLREVTAQTKTPVTLMTVLWCREEIPLLDHRDQDAQLAAAGNLAGHIAVLRKEAPNCRIVLVAHSTGTRVALAAAEASAEKSINRIILLGSGVSCGYDLRPALRAARGGIDSVYNPSDSVLALAEGDMGTADGRFNTQCAGLVGFRPYRDPAYAGLRQYEWSRIRPGTGGHDAYAFPGFLRNFVVPLALTDMAAVGK